MRLPAEITLHILEHLYRPLPPPGRRAQRSEVGQTDLATAMRVNKVRTLACAAFDARTDLAELQEPTYIAQTC